MGIFGDMAGSWASDKGDQNTQGMNLLEIKT